MARRTLKAVEADEMALLSCLVALSPSGVPVFASINRLAAASGLSHNQVRRALRVLSNDGRLTIEQRFLPNGGQIENAYHLTEAGLTCVGRDAQTPL